MKAVVQWLNFYCPQERVIKNISDRNRVFVFRTFAVHVSPYTSVGMSCRFCDLSFDCHSAVFKHKQGASRTAEFRWYCPGTSGRVPSFDVEM
jgi:hypothetical protein